MRVRVISYSGYKADQRPLAFFLGECRHKVAEVLDQWYSPGKTYFKVRAGDGDVYILCHETCAEEDFWTLESYRRDRDLSPMRQAGTHD